MSPYAATTVRYAEARKWSSKIGDRTFRIAPLNAVENRKMLAQRVENPGRDRGPIVHLPRQVDVVHDPRIHRRNGPVLKGFDKRDVHVGIERHEGAVEVGGGQIGVGGIQHSLMAGAHVGQPLTAARGRNSRIAWSSMTLRNW